MYLADLHIHSHYSMATSRDCRPEQLDLWARRKGLSLIGTGDFTHPAWQKELGEKLEPAEDGLYCLKREYQCREGGQLGLSADAIVENHNPRFVVSGEISTIYKKNGKTRKVHSLILLPGLEAAKRISTRLEQVGNLHSDGRPILGLDCRELLELLLELCPEVIYVPAHVWTPHFSVLGAFSAFQSLEECYEDLTHYVRAVETGLSSDPVMNWRVSSLDACQLISNSDAHSPAKLGREATILSGELSYEGLRKAIQEGDGLAGTVEFFPEEGKYHLDGHRKCDVCLTPEQTAAYGGRCPVCGKKITVGVLNRLEQLADRSEGYVRGFAPGFESLMPLPEVLAEVTGRSVTGKGVQQAYLDLLERLGPEFKILRTIPLEEVKKVGNEVFGDTGRKARSTLYSIGSDLSYGERLAEGIRRLRAGEVERISGFDGMYGKIKLY